VSDSMIARSERSVAIHARDTPQYQFARAKLDALLGDKAPADTSLEALLDTYGERLTDDDLILTDVLQIVLLASRLDLAADVLNRRFHTEKWLRVAFEHREPARLHVLGLRLNGRSSAVFSVSDQLGISDRFDVVVGRWIAVLQIFAAYYRQGSVKTGEIKINLGDHGDEPGLAFCERRSDYFLIPDSYYIATQAYKDLRRHCALNDVPWPQRHPVAFWRGTTTGDPSHSIDWRLLARVRLCEIGREKSDLIDAGLSDITQMPNVEAGEEVRASGLMASFVPSTEFNKFRYQIDIDGNTNSWSGLFQKLLTGSPVLKVASPQGFRQWYYDRLKPWVNYIPVAADMSDLVDKIRWLREHDDAARAIGEQGQALALSMDYEDELKRAGRTITAALNHFAGRPETELRFGLGEADNACLCEGWSLLSDAGAAASGFESRLKLLRPVATADFVLSLDLSPATEPWAITPQGVVIVANGEVLLESTLSERVMLHCALSRRTIVTDEALLVTLRHPDARINTSAANPLDTRAVSVVLHGVSLMAARLHAERPSPIALTQPEVALSAILEAKMGETVPTISSGNLRHLLTHHGTVVYLDIDSGELRHGEVASNRPNVFLLAQTGTETAYLVHLLADGELSNISVEVCSTPTPVQLHALSSELPQTWSLMGAEANAIGLFSNDHYLCASPDGTVTLSRQRRGPWELFFPTEADAPVMDDAPIRSETRSSPTVGLHNDTAAEPATRATMLVPRTAIIQSCLRTNGEYGDGIAVTDSSQGFDCQLKWDFVARAGWYEIRAEYASNEERPMTIRINQDVLSHSALSETTGGWFENHQDWRSQTTVFLQEGLHTISLRRSGAIPHIRTIAIAPVEKPDKVTAAGLRTQKPERVLVCVLAQTRAHQLTWRNFKKHVLDELGGDLALCIGVDDTYDYGNPFWQHARFRWTSPEYDDFGDAFDLAQRHLGQEKWPITFDWRELMLVKDQWLGGIKGRDAHPGSAAILIYFRWLLLQNIVSEGLLSKYDRFVITRSDFFWSIPHPPLSVLSPSEIWFPDGEYWGGLTDRHHIVSTDDIPKVINLIDDIVLRPDYLTARMSTRGDWNLERYILFHLVEHDLLRRTKLFPYVMFTVRDDTDKTRWAAGSLNEDLGLIVKYDTELASAKAWEGRIRTRRDWEQLWAEDSSHFPRYGLCS
jgi:hypothetical protein